jgi:hypothetical protein
MEIDKKKGGHRGDSALLTHQAATHEQHRRPGHKLSREIATEDAVKEWRQ